MNEIKTIGQAAYEAYLRAMAREGVDCDSWHELDDLDRMAWNEAAETIAAETAEAHK